MYITFSWAFRVLTHVPPPPHYQINDTTIAYSYLLSVIHTRGKYHKQQNLLETAHLWDVNQYGKWPWHKNSRKIHKHYYMQLLLSWQQNIGNTTNNHDAWPNHIPGSSLGKHGRITNSGIDANRAARKPIHHAPTQRGSDESISMLQENEV